MSVHRGLSCSNIRQSTPTLRKPQDFFPRHQQHFPRHVTTTYDPRGYVFVSFIVHRFLYDIYRYYAVDVGGIKGDGLLCYWSWVLVFLEGIAALFMLLRLISPFCPLEKKKQE